MLAHDFKTQRSDELTESRWPQGWLHCHGDNVGQINEEHVGQVTKLSDMTEQPGQVFKAWLHPGRCLFSLSTVWKPQFLISDLHVMARSFTLSCKNKLLLIDNCLMADKRPGQSRQSDKITTSFYGLIWQNCKNLAVSFDENIARNKISNQCQCIPEVTYNFRHKEEWLSRFKKFESAEQPLWLSEWK